MTAKDDNAQKPKGNLFGMESPDFAMTGSLLHAAATGGNVHLNGQRIFSANPVTVSQDVSAPTVSMATRTQGQWHLQASSGYDINVLTAWQDYNGAGVTVGIVDSGVQYSHSELSANYNSAIDYDFLMDNNDGGIKNTNTNYGHGTCVAGCIAAADNGTGSTGVAFGSTITSFRLIGGSVYGSQVAAALSQDVDVSNNSWGWGQPLVDGVFGSTIENAMQSAVQNNRGGLGTALVFSAGNSKQEGDNTNYSEMTNSRFTITVGAVNQDGTSSYFSTPGASVLISAPGTNIYTTDVTGSGGYSSGDYTSIQGTSFSAPITSGVVALMLEANANLGYRDIQEILAYSARQTDIGNSAWQWNGAGNWNGGGMHTSDVFGFGFLDATSAVRLAETWLLPPGRSAGVYANEDRVTAASGSLNQSINGNTYNGVAHLSSSLNIQYVELQLSMTHTYVPDLSISLTSADGTQSILFNRPTNPYQSSYNNIWSFSSTQFWGEMASGDWTLSITDAAGNSAGTLSNWSLRFYGDLLNNDDTYVYTDEFSRFTGVGDAARRILSDSAGNDTINAAAVTGDSVINLSEGSTSTLAGNTLAIQSGSTIENAISGDGNDVLTGNIANNYLYGGRGNDTLDGGVGVDTLAGGAGDDVYYVDSLSDVVIELANEGYDIVYSSLANYVLSANVEELRLISGGGNVTGSAGDDHIGGNDSDNILSGLGGNDTMDGAGGNDTLYGGDGHDSIWGGSGDDWLEGGDGNDTLYGGIGQDTMLGGLGDDNYYVDSSSDVVTESAGAGMDTVFAYASFTLSNHIENIYLQGVGDINAVGNGDDNRLGGNLGNNTLDGADGNDYLDGLTGNDTLIGGLGNDTLDGGAGTDRLLGGAGDDLYSVDDTNDVIVESPGEGNDSVLSSVSYTLSPNVEFLTLTGSAHINATGNALDNVLTGNSGNNALYGLEGNDTLFGGQGSDSLYGGDGNDVLRGGGGNDTLVGGLGDDVYDYVNSINYVLVENAHEGIDTVIANDNYTLGANLENLTLYDSGYNFWGRGNALDNVIRGNSGNNALYGLDGNDTLDGGLGNDLLDGGLGNDTYDFSALTGFGADTIRDSGGNDVLNLSNVTFGSVQQWLAIDGNDADNFVDSLFLDFGSYSLVLQNYFSNTSVDDDLSTAGAGFVENLQFSDVAVTTLAQVQSAVVG